MTKLIIDHVLLKHQLEELKQILLLTLALIFIQLPVNVGVSYLCAKWTQTIIYRLREQLGTLFITHKENAPKNGLFINTLSNPKELKRQLVGIPNYRYNRETGVDSENWTKTSPIKSQLLETDGKTVYFSGMIYRKEINVELPEEDWIQGKKFQVNQQQMKQLKQARAREYQRYTQEQFFHE